MWDGHGFSFGIAHKKVRVPTIIHDKVLYSPSDHDLRTHFTDMLRLYNADTHIPMEAIDDHKRKDPGQPTLQFSIIIVYNLSAPSSHVFFRISRENDEMWSWKYFS